MALHPGERKRHFPDEAPVTSDPNRRDSKENEDWCRDLVEHSHDLLCVHDLEGRFLSVNPTSARQLGYSVEELLRRPMRDFVDPQFRDQFDAYLREIGRTGEASGLLALVARSGERRIWEYRNSLRTEGVETPIVRGIAHDVTDRVRAEKALRASNEQLLKTSQEHERMLRELTLFRTLLDQSNDAIKVIDLETLHILDVNERSYAELGYSREELLSMTVYDIDPNADANLARVRQQLQESGFATLETVHRRKDGTTFPVEVNLRRVQLDREYVVSISRDITERKRDDERLREFERVVESLEEMIVVVDRDYRYVLANRAYLSYRGMTKKQVVGRLVVELVNPEPYETVIKEKLDECFQGKVVTYGLRLKYQEMGERDLSITYLPIEGPSGIDRVACILKDITTRKRAEEALRTSEREQHKIAEQLETERARLIEAQAVAKVGSWETELPSLDITWSEQTHRIFETDPSNFHPRRPSFVELVHPEDRAKVDATFEASLENGAPSTVEYRIVMADGRVKVLEEHWRVFQGGQGWPARLMGTCQDITERKQAAAMLRESELRFRTVYERSPIGIALVDSCSGRYLQVNPKYLEIAGRKEEDLLQRDVASITHPDDLALTGEFLRRVAEEKAGPQEMEKRYLRPDGSVRWVRVLAVPMTGKDETQRWHMGLVEDITERKQAQEALRQSEERFRVALKNSPITVFTQDLDLSYIWMYNQQIGGIDYRGKTPKDFFAGAQGEHITEIRRQVLKTGLGARHDVQITEGSKRRFFETTIEPLFDSAGAIVGITGASADVTEMHETTEALREAKRKLTEEKLYLEHEIDTELGFGEIIGRSPALQAVMENVGKVASSDATVLLLGETGTGKELVARAIHRLSQRVNKGFIKMNCAAIPSGLLESELFGNEKGAFTGAVSRKIGRLELADKGTLFLDEIGEISLALQPKLLRVLQDQEFERLGGIQTLKVDFRLIAATNLDLAASVRENEFRSDLYYRLNVFPICVPPLRERRDDIPLLVEHFVQKCARRMNKSVTSIPKKTMDTLIAWEWPGNVRELENFIERSVILTQGTVLAAPLYALEPATFEKKQVDETFEGTEREHILRALRESRGKIGGLHGAAMRLGLKRTTLQSKLKHLGIAPGAGSPRS